MRLALKILIPILIIGAAVAVAAVVIKTKPKPDPVAVQEKAWRVAVQKIEKRAWSPSLTLYGRVESLWSSQLTAGVMADVLAVSVVEGDLVEKGDLLVRLDQRDAKLQLLQREADLAEAEAKIAAEEASHEANLEALPREKRLLALARAEVKRLDDLARKQVGSKSQLDTARQAVERQAIIITAREQNLRQFQPKLAELKARRARAEALRDQARLELERCEVTAPFAGLIAQVLVSPGKRVRAGDSLLQLYDTGSLMVRAQLPSRYLPAIHRARAEGRKLIVAGEIDGQPIQAELTRLAGEVSSASGGVEGLFAIQGETDLLRQGRFVRMDLDLPAKDDLVALPPEAVYGTDRIYRIDGDSRMRPLRVERVGETRDADGRSLVLIRSTELQDGDEIIATQLPNALDGLLVARAE